MRYPLVFWDSGGTIFSFGKQPEDFGGSPSPVAVVEKRAFRAGMTMKMFGHIPPRDLSALIDELENSLSEDHGARYSFEMLALELYRRFNISRTEEMLILADAIAGPRYRSWLYHGVSAALSELHNAGVRMGIIANTALTGRMMRNALTGVGLAGFFETIVCSCDMGIEKPDRRIFEKALDSMNLRGISKCPVLYVGDMIEYDINGPVSCGWDAALHLTTPENPQSGASFSFRDYSELVSFIIKGSCK